MSETFDHIVISGGSSGCVAAVRLVDAGARPSGNAMGSVPGNISVEIEAIVPVSLDRTPGT
jgi:hypothetical protein